MAEKSTEGCRIEVVENGFALRLVLDNPPQNRITPSILQAIGGALDRLESGKGPSLFLLTGSGRTFSKGFDEDEIRANAQSGMQRASLHLWNDAVSRLASSNGLTIAVVNGVCLGGGLELALACHLRFCSEKARLGLPELGLGLMPGLGGIYRLVHLVGRSKALELLVGGDLVTAAEALRLGLANRVVPHDHLDAAVAAFARSLSTLDRGLVRDAIGLTALAERTSGEESVAATVDVILADQVGRRVP
jgi:enoyl-CoA hydratase